LAEAERQRLQDCLETMANVSNLETNMSAVRNSIAEVIADRNKCSNQTL